MNAPVKRAGIIIGFIAALVGIFFAAAIMAPSASIAQEGTPHLLLELKDGTVDIELLPGVYTAAAR